MVKLNDKQHDFDRKIKSKNKEIEDLEERIAKK